MGGPQADVAMEQDGAVLVYERPTSSWVFLKRLNASTAGSYDFLGSAVDVDTGIALAGAPGHDRVSPDAGSVSVIGASIPARNRTGTRERGAGRVIHSLL